MWQMEYRFPCISSIQSLGCVRLFVTPWTAAGQASLSITNSQRLLKLTSIQSVMPSNHLILCRPLLLLPSIFLSIRVFSNESVLHIRWPKYWSFSFSISPSNEYSGLISFRMDQLDLLAVQGTLKSLIFSLKFWSRIQSSITLDSTVQSLVSFKMKQFCRFSLTLMTQIYWNNIEQLFCKCSSV